MALGRTGRLVHGGGLRVVSARYGIALADWLDLSTGINPQAYRAMTPAAEAWQRLPEDNDGLQAVAGRYYGTESLLPVAGSQAAIKALPRLRSPGRVLIPAPSYAEHAQAWRDGGHEVFCIDIAAIDDAALDWADVVVVVNPNNPNGHCYDPGQLERWRRRLVARGGWLVVDEAFMDPTPECSVIRASMPDGLVVLRSLGKFFGLAGIRVGFVAASAPLCAELDSFLGPWTVSGPSRDVAQQALADTIWVRQTRVWLEERSGVTARLLRRFGLPPQASTALFHWVPTPMAHDWQHALARQGVWSRRFEAPSALRFGLVGDDAAYGRLEAALTVAREAVQG